MLVSHREAIGEHMVKTREIVFPGDIVQAEGTKPRNGTYRNSDGTYSSCYFGTVQVSEQFPRRGTFFRNLYAETGETK
jgi:ribosomal RNA-processing protein RRP4 (EC 3.1.13.-)